jgi:hypothetical protein
MSDRLNINNEMAAFDRKDRRYYDELTDDERKKFSTYLMLKWGSGVDGNPDIEEYYLRATNENINVHFFDLGRHPKLQWLLCTSVSPGMGKQRHYFVKPTKGKTNNPCLKFLIKMYPSHKVSDLELLVKLNDQRYFEDLARKHGWSDEEIKNFFK